MTVTAAKYSDPGATTIRAVVDGKAIFLPDTARDRRRWGVQDWIDGGNTIAAADPAPPAPTDGDRADASFTRNPALRALIKREARTRGVPLRQVIDELKAEL